MMMKRMFVGKGLKSRSGIKRFHHIGCQGHRNAVL